MYEILTQCPLFRGMDAGQIERILGTVDFTVTRYAGGELIAKRDTAYSGLMIIISGRVAGTFRYPSGATVNIDPLEAPQLIAPAFLFGGYNRLPVDVTAETQVEILTIHRGGLFELMQNEMLILSNFIDIISNRAGVWSKRIYALSFETLREKLASYLLDHSADGADLVHMPDIRETAEYFGATRSSLQTVMEGLEKRGVVATEGDNIRIVNRRALADILD